MVGVLHECTRAEQHAVVRFLWAKGLSTEEMHRKMCPVHSDNCFSCKTVFNWIQEFNKRRQSIWDRERPGHPAEVLTEATVLHVKQIICNDQLVSINYVAHAVRCSQGTAYNIMHEGLKFRKDYARWVPRRLTEEQKMFWMSLSLQYLNRYTEKGEDFMARIVVGDESWVHLLLPESKRSSMEWKHCTFPTEKSSRPFHQPARLCSPCFGTCKGFYCRNSSLTMRIWMPLLTAPLCRNSDRLFITSDLDSWWRKWFFWMIMPALTQQE